MKHYITQSLPFLVEAVRCNEGCEIGLIQSPRCETFCFVLLSESLYSKLSPVAMAASHNLRLYGLEILIFYLVVIATCCGCLDIY